VQHDHPQGEAAYRVAGAPAFSSGGGGGGGGGGGDGDWTTAAKRQVTCDDVIAG